MTAVIHKTSVGAGGKHTLSPEESLRQSVSLIWEITPYAHNRSRGNTPAIGIHFVHNTSSTEVIIVM